MAKCSCSNLLICNTCFAGLHPDTLQRAVLWFIAFLTSLLQSDVAVPVISGCLFMLSMFLLCCLDCMFEGLNKLQLAALSTVSPDLVFGVVLSKACNLMPLWGSCWLKIMSVLATLGAMDFGTWWSCFGCFSIRTFLTCYLQYEIGEWKICCQFLAVWYVLVLTVHNSFLFEDLS